MHEAGVLLAWTCPLVQRWSRFQRGLGPPETPSLPLSSCSETTHTKSDIKKRHGMYLLRYHVSVGAIFSQSYHTKFFDIVRLYSHSHKELKIFPLGNVVGPTIYCTPSNCLPYCALICMMEPDLRSECKISFTDKAVAAFPEDTLAVDLERNFVVLVIGTGVLEVTEHLVVRR